MLSPRQLFEDNIRPAELLLRVFRLLESDSVKTEGQMVDSLRKLVDAHADEGLMLIYNEIFLGLIRERAHVPPAALKKSALCNLLRQAVVASATALETYLPALLQKELPAVIALKGREFVPPDKEVQAYFKNMTFSLDEALRILASPDPLFISGKMVGYANYTYLSAKRGVHVTGSLLAIEKPWTKIADKLQRDEQDLTKLVDEATSRRNDIVHRADRLKGNSGGDAQEITYSWTKQAVDTVMHVCLCLDELVAARIKELSSQNTVADTANA